jgi:23S rRNA (pseudouridine1915-N3)-methyltransferase
VKVTLLAFGKLKNPGLRDAQDYYLSLGRSILGGALAEVELKTSSKPGEETTRVRERLPRSGKWALILMDERGQSHRTTEWAQALKKIRDQGTSELFFAVGSSYGFSEDLRKEAHALWSLGPQTLPHELARVVLTEQIYRSFSLLLGHPYHHEG